MNPVDSVIREAIAASKTVDEFEAVCRLIEKRPEWEAMGRSQFVRLVNDRIMEIVREWCNGNPV